MIQEIAPHRFDLTFRRQAARDEDFLLYIWKNKTLLRKRVDGGYELPRFGDFPDRREQDRERACYLFAIDGTAYFYVPGSEQEETGEYVFCDTGVFRTLTPSYQAFAGITATQLYRWKESRRFCGRCGRPMEDSERERALVCPECGLTEYPKISPAVIVAIYDGDRLLMSRYRPSPDHQYRGYALIAGFVEIGESFEDTIRREVMEEVGIRVKNIRYYKSQPWAFSDTEMIGFFAELDGDATITLQEDELSEAGWFPREEIPDDLVMNSIGSEMKMVFKYGSLEKVKERRLTEGQTAAGGPAKVRTGA